LIQLVNILYQFKDNIDINKLLNYHNT